MTRDDGYSVNLRRDRRTGEYLAFMPRAYRNHNGERYYMAYTIADGWVELLPDYATRVTYSVPAGDARAVKRATDRNLGYILNVMPRLLG